jgi:hypothetical protein
MFTEKTKLEEARKTQIELLELVGFLILTAEVLKSTGLFI